jgi:hypothetical protein
MLAITADDDTVRNRAAIALWSICVQSFMPYTARLSAIRSQNGL